MIGDLGLGLRLWSGIGDSGLEILNWGLGLRFRISVGDVELNWRLRICVGD